MISILSTRTTEEPQAPRLPLFFNIFDARSWTSNTIVLCSVKIHVLLFSSQCLAKPKTEQPGKKWFQWESHDIQEGFSSCKQRCNGSAWLKNAQANSLTSIETILISNSQCQQFQRKVLSGFLFHTYRVANWKPRQGENWESLKCYWTGMFCNKLSNTTSNHLELQYTSPSLILALQLHTVIHRP